MGIRTVLCLYAMTGMCGFAHAEVPKVGDTFGIHAGVLCDTSAQIADIVKAGATVFEGAQAKYKEYKATQNERGEPVCWNGRWAVNQPIVSVEILPDFFGIGGFSHAWSVGLVNEGIAGFLLWEEPVAIQPSSMPLKGREGDLRFILYEPNPVPWLWMFGA